MAAPNAFDARSPADDLRLVQAHPLAWIVGGSATAVDGPLSTLLPLVPVTDASGRLVRLVGHFARRNPQFEALQADPRALVLFLGAHGYVSPSWMADRTQAPTWNYASLRCRVALRFHEDTARLRDEIAALVDRHEAGRPARWSVEDMGARYDRLAQAIVGFEAEVLDAQGRYKLGQDERDDVYADIVRGLAADPGSEGLLSWMREFNPGRG